MQIHLKQKEIEAALKNFVAQQGINLTGKTMGYNFTAGRKDSGISVELTIEDNEIPGYTSVDVEEVKAPKQETPVAVAAVASIAVPEETEPAKPAPAVVTSLFSST